MWSHRRKIMSLPKFLLPLNLQLFAAEEGANGGGGYASITDEQFNEFFGGETEPVEPTTEVEETDLNEESNSEVSDLDEEYVEEEEGEIGEPGNSELYKVKADGVEHELTLEELINNASAGMNYTQKSQKHAQELAEFRQEKETFEQERVKYQPFEELYGLFSDYQGLEQHVSNAINSFFSGEGEVNSQATHTQNQFDIARDPRFVETQKQLQQTQSQLQELLKAQSAREIQGEWDNLFKRYPDAKDPKVQQQLADYADDQIAKGFNINLEIAYRNIMFDNIQTKTREQIAKNATKKSTAKTVAPKSTGNKTQTIQPKTYADVWDKIQMESPFSE